MLQRIFGITTDFQRIFFSNEYRALSGNNNRTVKALVVILFFTFLALGFAAGSLQNLRQKMTNPFTNWVDLEVRTSQIHENVGRIREYYDKEETRAAIDLKVVNGWVGLYQDFYANGFDPFTTDPDSLRYQLKGRSIEPDEPLLTQILSHNAENNNLIWYDSARLDLSDLSSYDGVDIIINEDMMQRLGYRDGAELRNIASIDSTDVLFIGVAAVVRELPNFCNFICTPRLYNILKAKTDGRKKCQDLIQRNADKNNIFRFYCRNAEARMAFENYCTEHLSGYNPAFSQDDALAHGKSVYPIGSMAFPPAQVPPFDTILALFAEASRTIAVKPYVSMEWKGGGCGGMNPADYHYMAFNFNKLDKIREFRAEMLENFKVDIDMSQVESKENFALVSGLTQTISFLLLTFGILSIVLFVDNLLKNHLFEMRSNLGTFQAFGLDNRFLVGIYKKIMLAFIFLSIGIALLCALIADRVEQAIYQSESRFDIFNAWIIAAIALLTVVSLWLTTRTIKTILHKTPGDLIYER